MQMKTAVALGLGQVVAAQVATPFSNSTTTATSATSASSTSASASSSASVDPADTGDFSFLGCFSSSDGFAGLSLIDTDGSQTLANCADSCDGDYFGIYFE